MAAKKAKGRKKAVPRPKTTKAKAGKKTARAGRSRKAAKPARAPSSAAIAKAVKADGDLPVHAYIGSLPGWQRDAARRFDDLITRTVPAVHRAVKWSAAFYGVPDQGWFASVKGFKNVVKFTFFKGTSLKPVPPSGASAQARSFDLKEKDAFDEEKMAKWVRQASAIPGWGS